MGEIIGGRFHGKGAAVYVCIGFVPDWVRFWNVELNTPAYVEWNKNMAQVLCNEGIFRPEAGTALEDLAAGEGVQTYYGGDTLTSTTQPSVVYGHADVNYIERDDMDYRKGGGGTKDATSDDIVKWTLVSGYTGHFNEDVTGTYIGPGSEICIDGKWYSIMILAAGQGEATTEVTLDHTGVPSGVVEHIGGQYGFHPVPVGNVTQAGFYIAETTVNASGHIVAFEAGRYDL